MLLKTKITFFITSILLLILLPQLGYSHGMSDAEKQLIIEGGNLHYIWIGATHMLSGYDHLLFVFGIIFFLTRFKDIVKYITAFTLGHSVTLIFATFNAIQINYFLIDAIIALSVCYIAFVNLGGFKKQLNINPPNMLMMITGFGLIHGLGLSTRLQQLPLSEDQLLMNIISFNLGIEIGQIAALTLMLLVISVFRKSRAFATFSRITNALLILAGGYLFLMQMHGYAHTSHPEEFIVEQPAHNSEITALTTTQPEWRDTITLTLPARSDKEYKLQLKKGATLEYQWETDGTALFFDFHGEPENDNSGFFKSYTKGTESQSSRSLTTPFTGTHGWYWKNHSSSPVTLTLKTKGEYQRLGLDKSLDQFEAEMDMMDSGL
ncbi:MAG: HupE/UreJ family protein [Gammaproteobacteria bacterium]|nr:HupE/UreJ family protein [Gammaproteobacteria bacterium]MCF6231045.1 HupE/UreJ family protein [Gammaproteobacteria bacterium]